MSISSPYLNPLFSLPCLITENPHEIWDRERSAASPKKTHPLLSQFCRGQPYSVVLPQPFWKIWSAAKVSPQSISYVDLGSNHCSSAIAAWTAQSSLHLDFSPHSFRGRFAIFVPSFPHILNSDPWHLLYFLRMIFLRFLVMLMGMVMSS